MCQRDVERIQVSQDASATGAITRDMARDTLVVEAPLELRMGGKPVVVVMRTPGNDQELARGLMFAEGVTGVDELMDDMAEPEDLPAEVRGNVLELGIPPPATLAARSMVSSSSCGVCGKIAFADLERRLEACTSGLQVSADLVIELPQRLRAAQAVFATTGGLHAAGAFDARGTLLAVREDVGRHNAVDKLIGWALAAGRVPCSDSILCVSGRLGFEIVQKAVAAGFPVVVAVSAPSSLAVDLAERYRVTVCGFTRNGRFNAYSHASRIS